MYDGQATAVGVGQAIVSAKYQGATGTIPITVTSVVTGIAVYGTTGFSFSASSTPKQTGQAYATAALDYSDLSPVNATNDVTWQSSNTSVMTVSNVGVLTAVGAGEASISARFQGFTAAMQTTVSSAPLNLTGTFVGTMKVGPMSLLLTQTGSSISGGGSTDYGFVLVTGTVNGAAVTLSLKDNGGCFSTVYTITVTSATNTSIVGTFTKNGGCADRFDSGSFSLTKQ